MTRTQLTIHIDLGDDPEQATSKFEAARIVSELLRTHLPKYRTTVSTNNNNSLDKD